MVRQVREARRTPDLESRVRLGKFVVLLLVTAAAVAAQDQAGAEVSALQQAVDKTAAWQALAKSVESRLARMLPCDPRVRAAIQELSKASEDRLAALAVYLQGAAVQAKHDAEAASALLEAEQAASRDLNFDTAEAEQDRIAVEAQLADLTASAASKPALEVARKKLAAIAAMARQRAADAAAQGAKSGALNAALQNVAAAARAKQTALETELGSLVVEPRAGAIITPRDWLARRLNAR